MRRPTSSRGRLFRKARYHQGPTPLEEQSREQRRQDRGQRSSLRRRIYIGLILVMAGFGLYAFGFIRQVQVTGLDEATSSQIHNLTKAYLQRSWYGSFKPWAGLSRLADSIELADSRFSGTVAQTSWYNDTVVISSTLRTPKGVWQAQTDQSYWIDSTGVVYLDDQAQLPTTGLPRIVDTSGLKVAVGQQAISTNLLDFILLLDQQLKVKQLFANQPHSFWLGQSSKQIELAVEGLGYRVKFHSQRGAIDQVGELKAALKHLKAAGRQPSQYIDLRIDDTAYYR